MPPVPHGNFSGRRLLIVGAGYIGSAVAVEAIARGASVTALTRNEATAGVLRGLGVETIVADALDPIWHDRVAHMPDFVLNCLGAGRGGVENYRRSYVDGMDALLAWAGRGGGVGTLVYTSSTSVYPQGGGVRVDEAAPTAGEDDEGVRQGERQDRARILVEAERRLMTSQAACRRWFVLRLAGIYGPGRHHLLQQAQSGVVSGNGEHHLNLAHRDDVVSAIWACFGAPPSVSNQVFNVADDHPTPKKDVAAWLAEQIGAPRPEFTGEPAAAGRGVTPDRQIVNTKLKSVLGWQPRYPSFREGYERILADVARRGSEGRREGAGG